MSDKAGNTVTTTLSSSIIKVLKMKLSFYDPDEVLVFDENSVTQVDDKATDEIK